MAKKVTLQMVADECGLSLATVDRVINQRGGVTAAKEQQVISAARSLGLDRKLAIAPTQTFRVAILLQPATNPFHAELKAAVDDLRKVFSFLNIQLQVSSIDPNAPDKTAAQIADLKGTCEGLIICAPDSPQIAQALREISRKIKIVTLATHIENSGRAVHIGPDDERSGRVAADLMGLFTRPTGGNILMLAGRLDIAGHRARAKGFRDVLSAFHPHCTIARVIETREDNDMTAAAVYTALRDDPEICGIYHLTVGTVGIVHALETLGRSDRVVVITHEPTPNRRTLLKARKLHALLEQNPHLEMRLAIENMARLLNRLDGEVRSVNTDVQIVMPENA